MSPASNIVRKSTDFLWSLPERTYVPARNASAGPCPELPTTEV